MPRSENKSTRLSQIEALLIDHPEGLSLSNIAKRLGVHRSTILRNVADMSAPVYEDHDCLFIDRESYLVNLRLNLHEVLSIHLAGRLMATRMDRQNPHAAAAFRKLGIALGVNRCGENDADVRYRLSICKEVNLGAGSTG